MIKIYILLLPIMIFCHIVDDFYLQGILAKMKQKKWWEENYPDKLYENDYKVALAAHGFSWSFMVHLPILIWGMIYLNNIAFIITYFFNLLFFAYYHSKIDNKKANKYEINLKTDQIFHLEQIIIIWISFGILILLRKF